MSFASWLNTLVREKNLDTELIIEKEGPSGLNLIPLGVVLQAIKNAPAHERAGIKNMLVRIDFRNGSVLDYFKHLAGALAQ